MAKIKVTSKCEIYDGMSITFRAPCDSTAVDGLNVYYNGESQSFSFRDAHGNDLGGLGNLYKEGVYIHAILDTGNGVAYLQNADTNAYLEGHLNHFGQYDLYWWKRRVNYYTTEWESYNQTQGSFEFQNVTILDNGMSGYTSETFHYSASVSVDENGNLILDDAQSTEVNGDNYDTFFNMCYTNGYYFEESSTGRVFKQFGKSWQFGNSGYGYGYLVMSSAYLLGTRQVTTHHLGEWEHLKSADSEAYPHSGNSDNYEYIFLGIPFQNACNAPRISITSYTGAGTRGASNPNTLTFDFIPDIVFITSSDGQNVVGWFYGTTGGVSNSGSSSTLCYLTWSDKTLSWYSTSIEGQLNTSGQVYQCIAIKTSGVY